MSLVPTDDEIEAKAREMAEKDEISWAAIASGGEADQVIGTKQYWLQKAEEALKSARRNAL